MFIYILLLESSKYYIGKTENPDIILDFHLKSDSNQWINVFTPIKIEELISDCDSYDEDKYTLKYMEKKGINNVRGGSFSEVKLSEEQIKLINKMINKKPYDCIESKIEDCLKNINNEKLKENISIIRSIYEEIIELKRLIKITNFISIDDLSKIKKESEDMKNINKLREEMVIQQDKENKRSLKIKIRELEDKMRRSKTHNWGWHNVITNVYIHNIFKNKKTVIEDSVILGLEIIRFNLQKKKRLQDIYEEYYNEEFVKELLSRLYIKEIEIIKSEIK